jgi:hypothetical protein
MLRLLLPSLCLLVSCQLYILSCLITHRHALDYELSHSESNLLPVIFADALDGRRMLHPEAVRLKTGEKPVVMASITSAFTPPPCHSKNQRHIVVALQLTRFENSGTSFKS